MNPQKCNLIFTGRFVDGMETDTVYENIAGIFKTEVEKVKLKFVPDTPVIIKRDAEKELCLKMQKALLDAGVYCDIEDASETDDFFAEEPPAAQGSPAETPLPVPEASADPYSVPRSDIRVKTAEGADGFSGPYTVPASHGFGWVATGISIFLQSPGRWIVASLFYFLVNIIQLIPFIGPLIIMLIIPHLVAGFINGVKGLDENGIKPSPACMFGGFSLNGGSLFMLGLSIIGFGIIVGVLMIVVMMMTLGVNFSDFGNPAAMSSAPGPAMAILPMLIVLLFIIPVTMCYWFAVPLIAFNDQNVFEALSTSFSACLKNILSFLVYGVVLLLFYIILIAITATVVALFSGSGGGGAGVVVIFIILAVILFLCLVPVGFGTLYASYKDIFYNDQA